MPQPLDARFPEAVRELWAELSAKVVWLHGRWIIYRQLFGTNKDRVELLNEAAGTVTWILQDLLLHDVQLELSKVGDPAGGRDRTNLSVRRLQVSLRDAGESVLALRMEPPLVEFEAACAELRHRRNKWIAHSDLKTLLEARATPLLGPSRQEIEDALTALRQIMHCVELEYTGSQTAYEHFVMNEDGEHLLSALIRAKRYNELVSEGVVARDDLRKRFSGGV